MIRLWPAGWRPSTVFLRLALWYSLWVFALTAAVSGLFYGVRATNLDEHQDHEILADYLRIVRLFIESSPPVELRPPPIPASSPSQQAYVHVRVLDRDGRILLETPGMSDELAPPEPARLARWTSESGSEEHPVSLSGRSFLALGAAVPAGSDGQPPRYIQVAIDRSEAEVLIRVRDQSWLLLGLLVVACAGMGYSIMRRGMRPIEAMARTVERIHSRRLSERIATADLPSELARLAHTFNEMLDRLEGSFGRISQFSDNVAHELRTPINNLQSEIEVALSRGRTGDDYREVLASCLEECNRITRIVQGLLFLAREESSSSPILLEELDIPSELEAVKDFYEGLAADAGLHIEVDAPGALCARLDRTLLRQAISNLVSNAIEHTARGGLVRIRASRESAGIRVAVADTGEGIPAEHLPRVFERFYRVDGARSLSQRNVGLGLAIVKSIVARHGGQIGIESRPGVGTTVTIDFATAA